MEMGRNDHTAGKWGDVPTTQRERDTGQKANSILQVCRDFKRGQCTRPECSFAHPSANVQVHDDNTVRICMDHRLKKCERPTCKFYHEPLDSSED